MKFLKNLNRKSPEEKIKEELLAMEFTQASIFFPDKFSNFDLEIIRNVVNVLKQKGKINGEFVGTKGWFLFDAEKRYEEVWANLTKGGVNLEEQSKLWGNFGNKRVFIALENYGIQKKLSKPVFTRKENILYLNVFILQEWSDAVNRFDLEEDDVTFQTIIEQVNSNIRNVAAEIARISLSESISDIVLGDDDIVRRRHAIKLNLKEYIMTRLNNDSVSEIRYEEIASKFGLSEEDVSSMILKLIEDMDIENITNYPIDGFIKSR